MAKYKEKNLSNKRYEKLKSEDLIKIVKSLL